jgi:probable F420-dependent oxidoreductase
MHFGATMWFTEYSISPSELAVALEERGFESLWASEHSHLPVAGDAGEGELRRVQADVMDPFVTLTAAAMSTTMLKLGTGICLVNQRDPIQTAKLAASIDQLSAGRFLFGIGNGWHEEEMRNHGTVLATRHQLVQERVEAMRAIWTQEKAEYHGEFVSFGPMIANPKPVLRIPTMPPGHTEVEASTCSDLMPSTVLMRWRPGGVVSAGRLGSCHE